MMWKDRIIATMGASRQYPENTMLSFRQALAAGVTALEADVQYASDGVAVVCRQTRLPFPDGVRGPSQLPARCLAQYDTVPMMTGAALAPDYDMANLEHGFFRPSYGAGDAQELGRCVIPSLDELLAFGKENGLRLLLDMSYLCPPAEAKAGDICRQILALGMEEQCALVLDDHILLHTLSAQYPGIRCIARVMCRMHRMGRYARGIGAWGVMAYPIYCRDYAGIIDECHENNVAYYAWSPFGDYDVPEKAQTLLQCHADGVLTHDPQVLCDRLGHIEEARI